ncbi:MAG: alpha/beta fold hydrolase [Methylocapsa sp.]|nr:alpha/beta fold hydrolase [Methylocapsa sp.]
MAGIMIGGEEFWVLSEGDATKPALMLSTPLGTNVHFWDPQIPALLKYFRVVRYDSRGHGKTTADQPAFSIEELGRDALAIMDALGIEKAHWLGLSMGGVVGLWLLAYAGNRIGRAVLAGTAAQLPGADMWNSRIQAARDFGMSNVAIAAAERWFTKDFRDFEPEKVERVLAMVRATPLGGYTAACAALRDMDLREAIRTITNEVLVIAGRQDLSTPPGMSALVANSIKGAKLVSLDAPHMAVIEDEANFTRAVLDFLTAPEAAPAPPAPPRRKAAKARAAGKRAAWKKAAAEKAAAKPGRVRATAAAKKAAAKKARRKAPAAKRSGKKAVAKRRPKVREELRGRKSARVRTH